MSVLQQTVSLAAQLRAFSSLLSLPSLAQSVIKAFRRQGIGSADEFNTARFFLSRLESLSAAPTSLSLLRFRSKSSKSYEGGQGETVSSTSFQPQTRLTLASALWPQWSLVDVCARAGKTLISRSTLSASGSCRALRACLLAVPAAFRKGLRPSQKPSSTAEVKDADGRFGVGAVITVVPRPNEAMVYNIYGSESAAVILVCFLCA